MSRLKVLHIFPEFKRGGAQINVLRFIKSSKDDFEHYVAAAPFNGELEEEYRREVKKIFPIDMTSVSLKSIRILTKTIKELKPDIIHVNGKGAAFYGYISSFFTGKPYRIYHTMRGFHIKYSGIKLKLYLTFEKLAARRGDGNIMVSPSEKKLLNLNIPDLNQEKLFLIPNGIGIHKDTVLPEEIHSILEQYSINIVTLSRLSRQKDLITMIEAFERLKDKYPKAALHIMGGETPQDREYADKVRARLTKSPSKENIYLWGSVKDAGSLIRHYDLYWTTALFEGLPTAVVEAALCRTLIVGTKCVGNEDVIFPGKTGILTEAGNTTDNTRGLLKGLSLLGTEEATKLIDNAEILCKDFSIENNAIKLKELYNTGKISK
ncbi:MAG: hypothetical protein B6241_01870 [Spirochaetaceae bacterium 4572_59]|nr:MAG: hypothetical protein B6241_01870 [Spirochaetaceae bacterium 4572_59]